MSALDSGVKVLAGVSTGWSKEKNQQNEGNPGNRGRKALF